jgi:3-dehydroquinate dehydratase-1
MKRPHICGVVTCHDEEAIVQAAPLVDMFELRLDMMGREWPQTARLITKPWIATNRPAAEGASVGR